MYKRPAIIEVTKISVLFLILATLLLSYLKLNSIYDSFHKIDGEIKNIKQQVSITKNIENKIEESYSSATEEARIRNVMLSEIVNIAAMGQQYYRKPEAVGGGANSFYGFEIPDALKKAKDRNYNIQVTHTDTMLVIGNSNVLGADSKNPIELELKVTPNGIGKTIINN